jgi:hypothetical protein
MAQNGLKPLDNIVPVVEQRFNNEDGFEVFPGYDEYCSPNGEMWIEHFG